MQRSWHQRRLTTENTVTDRDIYEQLKSPLMRFAASLVGPDEASDLVSEVVLATMERRLLSSLENPGAYLMQAVLNRARSRARRLDRGVRAVARMGASSPVVSPLEGADPEVVRTVASLPIQQRAAVFLVYWEDLSPSEAADLMGVRPATLRRYLHQAREELRRHLDER